MRTKLDSPDLDDVDTGALRVLNVLAVLAVPAALYMVHTSTPPTCSPVPMRRDVLGVHGRPELQSFQHGGQSFPTREWAPAVEFGLRANTTRRHSEASVPSSFVVHFTTGRH